MGTVISLSPHELRLRGVYRVLPNAERRWALGPLPDVAALRPSWLDTGDIVRIAALREAWGIDRRGVECTTFEIVFERHVAGDRWVEQRSWILAGNDRAALEVAE